MKFMKGDYKNRCKKEVKGMDVLLEEKKCREGKELALELIRHGVPDRTIEDILEMERKTVCNWRNKLRERGWNSIETYGSPKELEQKLEKLSEYAGLYTKSAISARWEQKRELLKVMLAQGMKIKEISEILNVTEKTLRRWEKEKNSKEHESDEWIPEWRQEWDEFMRRLVRPIRLAGGK